MARTPAEKAALKKRLQRKPTPQKSKAELERDQREYQMMKWREADRIIAADYPRKQRKRTTQPRPVPIPTWTPGQRRNAYRTAKAKTPKAS